LDIDLKTMSLWSPEEVREWFESGGCRAPGADSAAVRAGLVANSCQPNAPTPAIPISDEDVSDTARHHGSSGPPAADAARIFCISDLHTDHKPNLEWCRALRAQGGFARDALIVAGDITSGLVVLEETFKILADAFGAVFYVPGNHDLWSRGSAGLHIRTTEIDSLQKHSELKQLCARLGVHVAPAYAAGAIIAPILSWYHSSWDTEPEIVGWDGIPTVEQTMMDFRMCTWPAPLATHDETIAQRFDQMNDEGTPLASRVAALRSAHPDAPLITFSHFVPRIEVCSPGVGLSAGAARARGYAHVLHAVPRHAQLNPEKRFLFFPPVAKASGSTYLAARVAALRPAVHVFGHVRGDGAERSSLVLTGTLTHLCLPS
jgi:hypothetical protein